MRMDALITEKLSSNKRVVTGYGFCAVAMIAAAMAHGDLERVAVPKSGRLKVEASTNQQLVVHNNLTPHQKLKYALEMVEEVAYLHGYANGVIVHDDIQPSQFLLDESDNLLLNDFNRAEIMFWDGNKNEYCRYRNNPGHGDVSNIFCLLCLIYFSFIGHIRYISNCFFLVLLFAQICIKNSGDHLKNTKTFPLMKRLIFGV